MSENVKVRAVHIDYAGDDGMPKPMVLGLDAKAGGTAHDYESLAESAFREGFPEWRLRSCKAADGDVSVPAETLQSFFEQPGVWLMTSASG